MIFRITTRLIILIASLALVSCAESSFTTDTYSSKFQDDRQKIEFLTKYLKLPTAIEATEFHIDYHDNSGILPGPSDWQITAIIKTSPASLKFWTQDMSLQSPPINLDWGYVLIPKDQPRWQLKSKPKIYQRNNENGYTAVFSPEGVIFKSVDSGI
jgi:hypothetical protein